MSTDFLLGAWTYRSVLNVPDPVDDFNKVKFGQGELTFEATAQPGTVRGELGFRSDPPDETDRGIARGCWHGSGRSALLFPSNERKAAMLYKKTQLKGIRDRLKKGKLSAKDQKIIADLLTGAEEVASLRTGKGKGKRVIAHLPFGMDVVK